MGARSSEDVVGVFGPLQSAGLAVPLPSRDLRGLLRALQTTNGRAHTVGQMEIMLGTWRAMLDLPDRYAAITAAEIQRVARKTFAPHRRNVVTLVPGEQPE